jgi:hypothetical protein
MVDARAIRFTHVARLWTFVSSRGVALTRAVTFLVAGQSRRLLSVTGCLKVVGGAKAITAMCRSVRRLPRAGQIVMFLPITIIAEIV